MARKKMPTKAKIVKAAWTLFYKNGYENTTIEDIIRLSKTSKGSFYHYFKGKESLLNTLAELFDEKYVEILPTFAPGTSAYDKLLTFNHEIFSMIETEIDVSIIAYRYASQLTTKEMRSLSDKDRYYFKVVTDTMAEGIAEGIFSDQHTPEYLMDIYAMFERALLYDWALHDGTFSLSEKSDKLLPKVLEQFMVKP